jgi:uncharacterized protein (DUF433 family)
MLQNFPIISVSPEIMGGTPVFTGTRVPVQTLLDHLIAGESIDDFLDGFPTVSRRQVIALLERCRLGGENKPALSLATIWSVSETAIDNLV